ncbi:MAG: NADPH-dependent F420 reductase [Pelolinea sp.]|nr:NADPH-dependent F420 reductase [Pelolinea sp.]
MNNNNGSKEVIAIIGGTGKEGKGLAYRWAKAGYPVIIGSRNEEKAQAAVNELKKYLDSKDGSSSLLFGKTNKEAVDICNIAVLTVPYEFHKSILQELKSNLQGKYLLDVTVPLVPPKVSTVQIPPFGSAALQAQRIVGEGVKVISAFQNISFELLLSENKIDCDVLVCGVDIESRELGLRLVSDAGLTGWDAGPLENSIVQEGLTSILIRINKKFGVHSAGIQINGVPRS